MDTEFTGPRAGCPVCNQPHRVYAGALVNHTGREVAPDKCPGSGSRTPREALEKLARKSYVLADYAIDWRGLYLGKNRPADVARFLPKLVKYGSLLRKTLEKLGRDPSEAESAILAELDKVAP